MCTLSVIRRLDQGRSAGLRVVMSRDEKRDRAPAQPPRWHGPARAIYPVDGDAGGTWIAGTARGLVLALLNYNPPEPPGPSPRSRGLVIPSLLESPDADAAAAALAGLGLQGLAPFRLIAISPDAPPRGWAGGCRITESTWDARTLSRREHGDLPACFVSSGLGDARVAPRLALFDRVVGPGPDEAAQDRFHAHAWPDRPEISVRMSRDDARTVSVTTVDVSPDAGDAWMVRMDYVPLPERVALNAAATAH